jgi:hypothetical protein
MSALTDTFTNIANAIRSKSGKSGVLTPAQMIAEISSLPTPIHGTTMVRYTDYLYSETAMTPRIEKVAFWGITSRPLIIVAPMYIWSAQSGSGTYFVVFDYVNNRTTLYQYYIYYNTDTRKDYFYIGGNDTEANRFTNVGTKEGSTMITFKTWSSNGGQGSKILRLMEDSSLPGGYYLSVATNTSVAATYYRTNYYFCIY